MSQEKSGVSESSIAQLFTDHVLGKNKPNESKLLTDQQIDSLSDGELLSELLTQKVMSEIHKAEFKRLNAIYKARQSAKNEKPPKKSVWDSLMPKLDALVTKKKQEKGHSEVAIIKHFCERVKNETGYDFTDGEMKSIRNRLSEWRKRNIKP